MAKRFCDSDLWQKEWFQLLSLKEKVIVKFLFENCDNAGIWEINLRLASFIIGESITLKDIKTINEKKHLFDFLENEKYIFIKNFVFFQCSITSYNQLNPNNNAHKSIIKRLKEFNMFLAPSQPLASPSLGAQEKEKEKEEEKEEEKEKDKDKENISSLVLSSFEEKPVFNPAKNSTKPINKEFRDNLVKLYKEREKKKENEVRSG